MYTRFFGFHEKPFQLVPNPAYLYLSRSHEEALANLAYAVDHGDGFVAVTGEVGTGKTTLCRAFLENLDAGVTAAYIFNPKLNAVELLQSINAEFGLPARTSQIKELIDTLNTFLMDQKKARRQVVIVIDEAQNLNQDVLEQLRLISNLETTQSKLVQIVLVGQPELDALLQAGEMRQLSQRINLRAKIRPLEGQEIPAYIQHRLEIASGGPPLARFQPAALRAIARATGGTPRLINILCDRTMLAAYGHNQYVISGAMVRNSIRELVQQGYHGFGATYRLPVIPAVTALLAGIVLILAGMGPGRDLLARWRSRTAVETAAPEPIRAPVQESIQSTVPKKVLPPNQKQNQEPDQIPIGESTQQLSLNTPQRAAQASSSPVPSEPGDPAEPSLSRKPAAHSQAIPDKEGTNSAPRQPNDPLPTESEVKMAAEPHSVPTVTAQSDRQKTAPDFADASVKRQANKLKDLAIQELGVYLAQTTRLPSRQEALDMVLARWRPEPRRSAELAQIPSTYTYYRVACAQNGLKLAHYKGDGTLLAALNLPAVLAVYKGADEVPGYLVLTAWEQGQPILTDGLTLIRATWATLTAHWRGTVYIPWENYLGYGDVISEKTAQESILNLKLHLRQVGMDNVTLGPVYDEATRTSVAQLQADHGLPVDGVVGPMTKIVLYNLGADWPIPQLAEW